MTVVVRPWPASFCARHWDKCIVGTTSASEGGRRKRWLSLFWVQSAHVTSHLLPEMTPEKVWPSPSHHVAGLSGSENMFVGLAELSLIAEGSGMSRSEWLPQVTTEWEKWVLKPTFPWLPPHVTHAPPPQPTQSDWALCPLQHQTTKPCDPPILTAGSTTRVCFCCAQICNYLQEPIVSVPKLAYARGTYINEWWLHRWMKY